MYTNQSSLIINTSAQNQQHGGDDDTNFERMINETLRGQNDLSIVNTNNLFLNEQPLEEDVEVEQVNVMPDASSAIRQGSSAPIDVQGAFFLQQQQQQSQQVLQQQDFQSLLQASFINPNTMSSFQANGSILPQVLLPARTPPLPREQEEDGEEDDEDGLLSKPKRSLSAYNLFFAAERKKLLKTLPPRQGKRKPRNSHGKLGFAEMARTISAKWKKITPEEKVEFSELARLDGIRYRTEMAQWKHMQHEKAVAKMQKMQSSNVFASSNAAGGEQTQGSSPFSYSYNNSNNLDQEATEVSTNHNNRDPLYLHNFAM